MSTSTLTALMRMFFTLLTLGWIFKAGGSDDPTRMLGCYIMAAASLLASALYRGDA